MKIMFDLPEDEIIDMAKKLVAEHIADRVIESSYSDGRFYRNTIKEVVRDVIRNDIDNLSDRAVKAASTSIENRAVKKLINKLEGI